MARPHCGGVSQAARRPPGGIADLPKKLMDDGWLQVRRGRGSAAGPHVPGPWREGFVELDGVLPSGSWVEREQDRPLTAPWTAFPLPEAEYSCPYVPLDVVVTAAL